MRSYLLAFVLSLLMGLLLTPVAARLGSRLGALDRAKSPPIPRAGGLAIVMASALALLALGLVFQPTRDLLTHAIDRLGMVFGAAALLVGLGLVDDIKGLRATPKLVVEVAVAAVLFWSGLRASTIWSPIGIVDFGLAGGLVVTVLWIVGITNAFNLLDGIDGAAGGSAVFALLAMFVTSLSLDQPLVALVTVAIAGATLGFLPYNFAPARVYLGDVGSLFLGFMLATLAIEGAQKGTTMVALAIPLVAFGLPVLDTGVAVVRRLVRGAPVFTGDKGHVHHRLLDLGLSPAQAALALYAVSAAFALASLLFINPNVRGMAVGLTIVGVAVWLAIRYLRLHEFAELARLARRGMTQTRAISFNVAVRRSAIELGQVTSWDRLLGALEALFAESEFDGVRLVVRYASAAGRSHDFQVGHPDAPPLGDTPQTDEWTVRLPFETGGSSGELTISRRYGRPAVVSDPNVLVETLLPALAAAATRVGPPPT